MPRARRSDAKGQDDTQVRCGQAHDQPEGSAPVSFSLSVPVGPLRNSSVCVDILSSLSASDRTQNSGKVDAANQKSEETKKNNGHKIVHAYGRSLTRHVKADR
jgi:hypothetical protein